MQRDHEDVAELRRLLRLKRHELPPPGFFDGLPDRVRAGIRADAATGEPAWWARWWSGLAWRPALIGAGAMAAMTLLVWRAGQAGPDGAPSVPVIAQERFLAAQGMRGLNAMSGGNLGGVPFKPVVDTATSSYSGMVSAPPPEGMFTHKLGNDFVLRASALVPLTNAAP